MTLKSESRLVYFSGSLFLTLFLFLLATVTLGQNQSPATTLPANPAIAPKATDSSLTYKIIPSVQNTWGYDIYRNRKLFIHQPSIPGVAGNKGFKTKEDAGTVARLVMAKIRKGEMPPSVTINEMQKIRVL